MYDRLYRIFNKTTLVLAIALLVGLAIEPVGHLLGLNSQQGVSIMAAILAAMVLIERKLSRLMIDEAWKESLGIDLEKASEDFYREEKERRRDEGKWH